MLESIFHLHRLAVTLANTANTVPRMTGRCIVVGLVLIQWWTESTGLEALFPLETMIFNGSVPIDHGCVAALSNEGLLNNS